uniref:Peroxisomal membrane protein PEX16 n=1 Tax=Steinernema glaseri TaxID=37863 RepID=A0A1I8AS52_9BILA
MWRIVRQLLNQERVIQQMADSRPMRLAARFAISTFYTGKDALSKSSPIGRIYNKTKTLFAEEYRKSLQQKS